MRKSWLASLSLHATRCHVQNGGTLYKCEKLHRPKSVDGLDDDADMCRPAAEELDTRWGKRNFTLCERLCDFGHRYEGCQFLIDEVVVENAFHKLRRPYRMDGEDISVSMLHIIFISSPANFVKWMAVSLASSAFMSGLSTSCKVFGKKSVHSLRADLRVIVPLSNLLRLFDRVLVLLLEPKVNDLFPIVPGIFVGAVKHTQCLDIAHAATLIIE